MVNMWPSSGLAAGELLTVHGLGRVNMPFSGLRVSSMYMRKVKKNPKYQKHLTAYSRSSTVKTIGCNMLSLPTLAAQSSPVPIDAPRARLLQGGR